MNFNILGRFTLRINTFNFIRMQIFVDFIRVTKLDYFGGNCYVYGLSKAKIHIFFLMLLARSNFDHYARECDFGILKKKKNHSAVF